LRLPLTNVACFAAAAEHYVVSNVSTIIPDRVKETWREYRAALKNKEKDEMGDNHISEDVEMVGWGVKEAEERNNSEAST
jgi:N-terminal acetyltransferase 2